MDRTKGLNMDISNATFKIVETADESLPILQVTHSDEKYPLVSLVMRREVAEFIVESAEARQRMLHRNAD